MNEDYDFDSYLNEIMSAVYGEEVRGSIRSALEILHNMLTEAEDGIIDIRSDALDAADRAAEYAAQAMATTPEGYADFALAIADVIGDIYMTQLDIDIIFDYGYEYGDIIVEEPADDDGTSSENSTGGSENDGE